MSELVLETTSKTALKPTPESVIGSEIDAEQNSADPDIQLLLGIASGDKQSLADLYDRYAPHVLAVTLQFLKNKPEAEDLVHDIFIEVWHKASTYDSSKGNVRSWLLLRARSRSIDRIRKLARIETRSEIEESEFEMNANVFDSPQDQLHAESQSYRQAHDAISSLKPEYALLIRASYFEDLSYREISKKYEIPEGTVKSRMLAAYKVLRKYLQQVAEAN